MKKLTSGIFASMLGLVAFGANAEIASKGYVDAKIASTGGDVTALDARVTTNEGAITSLANNISTETTNRTNADDALGVRIDGLADAKQDKLIPGKHIAIADDGKTITTTYTGTAPIVIDANSGAISLTTDSSITESNKTSTNPVQTKAVYDYVDGLVGDINATDLADALSQKVDNDTYASDKSAQSTKDSTQDSAIDARLTVADFNAADTDSIAVDNKKISVTFGNVDENNTTTAVTGKSVYDAIAAASNDAGDDISSEATAREFADALEKQNRQAADNKLVTDLNAEKAARKANDDAIIDSLGTLANISGACSTDNQCVLKFDGTNFKWEAIERGEASFEGTIDETAATPKTPATKATVTDTTLPADSTGEAA
ncbi:MAG: hypothetical protein IJ560_02445 [Alphaproteobacteria bacterium]|nr:hypothetical protein [Alphaproteobacteria bacterium]